MPEWLIRVNEVCCYKWLGDDCDLEIQIMECRLTYDKIDELGRGELQQGVAQLHGGRAEPHGAEGAEQRGQDRDGLPVAEGDPPVAIVFLVPVTLPYRHDPFTPEGEHDE